MKIQCDVCGKDEASLFCVADEAALCDACDHRVHHANKLAGKHQRFSLLYPSPKQAPLCDICHERRAFLFCQQDRAILCKDCDILMHKANEHTQKHARFLLTGVQISSSSALCSPPSSSAESNSSNTAVSNTKSRNSTNKPVSVPWTSAATAPESCEKINSHMMSGANFNGQVSASSISEYLVEMLPGWHVEEFLDSSSLPPYGFCTNGETDLLSFWDGGLGSDISTCTKEKMGLWVPQAPPASHQTQNQSNQSVELAFGAPNGFRDQCKHFAANNIKSSRKGNEDYSFAVPQISPPLTASKRPRTLS